MAGGTNHKLPSSMHKVLSNDDLLMEILLRLPIFLLHLFKPVCKQWLSLITSPNFILTRARIPIVDPPSGIFIALSSRKYFHYCFVSFDPRIPSKNLILLISGDSKAELVQSCNGLLLFYMHRHDEYSIYNPLISKLKMLPLTHDDLYGKRNEINQYRMAFDPTKSPYYKVAHAERVNDDESGHLIRIRTYSSETGVWSVCNDLFPYPSFNCFYLGTYWNGAIYWFSYHERSHVMKLDIMDRPILTKIQTPLRVTVQRQQVHTDRKLFKSRDSLLLFCKDNYLSRYLNIYEMKKGYSVWSVKYFVNLDDMMRPYPRWRMPTDWSCHDMLSIVLGERDEDDSFMVIHLYGMILQYKFVLETVTKLIDLERAVSQNSCFEYIACFARV